MSHKEIAEEVLGELVKSHRTLVKKIPFYEDNDKRFGTLLNNQVRLARTIIGYLATLEDPKSGIAAKNNGDDLVKLYERLGSGIVDGIVKMQMMTHKDWPEKIARSSENGQKISLSVVKDAEDRE